MNRFCGLMVLSCFIPLVSVRAERQPNVILILVDDLGWHDLACQGNSYVRTPHIDRMAAAGMRFTTGYAACAVCSPTRAALLTGRYPARIGVTDWIRGRVQHRRETPSANPTAYVRAPEQQLACPPNAYWMEHSEVTLAELLRDQGYATCHIGKWHLGDDAWFPTTQGFDVSHGGCDYGQPPSYFDPFVNPNVPQGIPGLPPRQKGEYLTDRESAEAIEFIRSHQDQPFFLYLAHYAVHTPLQAKPEVTATYEPFQSEGLKNPTYAAMIQSVDDAVGRIQSLLSELHLDERTLVIFTSDNGGLDRDGDPTDNDPLRSGKGFPYEGGIRVPFIIKWPGVVAPATLCHEPVCSIDLFPTVLAAAKMAPPATPLDGMSLMPLLLSNGTSKLDRSTLYWHFPHYREGTSPYSVIRKGNRKLIKYYEGPRFELYDLKTDLSESHDLAPANADEVQQLDQELQAHLMSVGAKIPRKE